jgi:hypothetical protein
MSSRAKDPITVHEELVARIKPILAGHPPAIQSMVLAELLAIWLAGHRDLDGDAEDLARFRKILLGGIVKLVLKLVPVCEKEIDHARQQKDIVSH